MFNRINRNESNPNWPPMFGSLHQNSWVIQIPKSDMKKKYAQKDNYQVSIVVTSMKNMRPLYLFNQSSR